MRRTYMVSFSACKRGAIGKSYPIRELVSVAVRGGARHAEIKDAIHMALLETYDHVHGLVINSEIQP